MIASFHRPINCLFSPIDCPVNQAIATFRQAIPSYRSNQSIATLFQAIALVSWPTSRSDCLEFQAIAHPIQSIACYAMSPSACYFWPSDCLLADMNSQVFMGIRQVSSHFLIYMSCSTLSLFFLQNIELSLSLSLSKIYIHPHISQHIYIHTQALSISLFIAVKTKKRKRRRINEQD